MAAKDELGRAGEERAVDYLRAHGYAILDRNWRCPLGEIDVVAITDSRLCIVEVKTRTSTSFGHPFYAVDDRKIRRLWRLAQAWIAAHPGMHGAVRLEAIGITGADAATGHLEHLVDLR